MANNQNSKLPSTKNILSKINPLEVKAMDNSPLEPAYRTGILGFLDFQMQPSYLGEEKKRY
jgi:hypothetical protein